MGVVKFGKGAVQPGRAVQRAWSHCCVREGAGHLADKVAAWPWQRSWPCGQVKGTFVMRGKLGAEWLFFRKAAVNSLKVSYFRIIGRDLARKCQKREVE